MGRAGGDWQRGDVLVAVVLDGVDVSGLDLDSEQVGG